VFGLWLYQRKDLPTREREKKEQKKEEKESLGVVKTLGRNLKQNATSLTEAKAPKT